MIDSSLGKRTLSFQSPSIIAIIPISNLPFPVLAVAPAYGPEQVFIKNRQPSKHLIVADFSMCA